MIPRLGDGNFTPYLASFFNASLENDSPSRGRKWKINRQSQQETVNFGINQYCIVLIN